MCKLFKSKTTPTVMIGVDGEYTERRIREIGGKWYAHAVYCERLLEEGGLVTGTDHVWELGANAPESLVAIREAPKKKTKKKKKSKKKREKGPGDE